MDTARNSNLVWEDKEKILGKFPIKEKKYTKYSEGQEVFLIAFLKKERGIFYICKAKIVQIPTKNNRRIYKIHITSVADKAIGGSPVVHQAQLLGLECIKKEDDLYTEIPKYLLPTSWISQNPS